MKELEQRIWLLEQKHEALAMKHDRLVVTVGDIDRDVTDELEHGDE